jgi:hypothetical protein
MSGTRPNWPPLDHKAADEALAQVEREEAFVRLWGTMAEDRWITEALHRLVVACGEGESDG